MCIKLRESYHPPYGRFSSTGANNGLASIGLEPDVHHRVRELYMWLYRAHLLCALLLMSVSLGLSGCAGTRTAVKREARWVIPVKCIYFASPQSKCQALTSGDYVCREVFIKTACVEPNENGWK
jgi:hypothetical protein